MQQIYVTKEYNRAHAVEYALEWALDRNPLFFDFTDYGGDCTKMAYWKNHNIIKSTIN